VFLAMTTKTTKAILFASLIAAILIPSSAMLMAEAAPNDNANDKAKEKVDRSQREAPAPYVDGDPVYIKEVDPNNVQDIPGPDYPKRSESPLANRGISVQAGSGVEAFGTDFDVNPGDLSGSYARMEVHTDLDVKADTFLFAPTMKGSGNAPLEIVTAYDNVGGSNEKQRVVLYNFNDDEYDWNNAKTINQDFLDDYGQTDSGSDYYYGQIWYSTVLEEWRALIYNYDTSSWELLDTDDDDYNTITGGWVAWEEHKMDDYWPWDDNCPSSLPQIDADRIDVYKSGTWYDATSTYASVMDTGASFNSDYHDWEVDD
jgi:hypothetical protein